METSLLLGQQRLPSPRLAQPGMPGNPLVAGLVLSPFKKFFLTPLLLTMAYIMGRTWPRAQMGSSWQYLLRTTIVLMEACQAACMSLPGLAQRTAAAGMQVRSSPPARLLAQRPGQASLSQRHRQKKPSSLASLMQLNLSLFLGKLLFMSNLPAQIHGAELSRP